jgi:hypothetical protein
MKPPSQQIRIGNVRTQRTQQKLSQQLFIPSWPPQPVGSPSVPQGQAE